MAREPDNKKKTNQPSSQQQPKPAEGGKSVTPPSGQKPHGAPDKKPPPRQTAQAKGAPGGQPAGTNAPGHPAKSVSPSSAPSSSKAGGTPPGKAASHSKTAVAKQSTRLVLLAVLLVAGLLAAGYFGILPNLFKPKANYDVGVDAYMRGDFKTSMAHFKVLAESGNTEAMWYVGDMYNNGRGVDRNVTTAVEWFRKAAKENQPWALFEIAWFYKNGTGGYKRDAGTALDMFEQSGTHGYSLGQYHAGLAYLEGIGTDKDIDKARERFTRAADQGHLESQALVGDMYYHGKGVKIDDRKAHQYLKAAAERGHPLAQMNLAMMYENGDVVKKNLVQAYQWYKLAASKGNEDARRSLEFIVPKLSAANKRKAEAWVADWQPLS